MDHGIINDIAVCIILAWMLGLVAHVFKQPLLLAYLIAGYLAGPAGLKLVIAEESIRGIGSMGLIFLLFMIGLEIDLKKMWSAGRVITLTSAAQILGGCLLGVIFFRLCGFQLGDGRLDALYLGVAAALSSTVIIVKILYDKRELDTLAGRLTLGVLVLQDLFAIIFLALLPSLSHPQVSVLLFSLFKVVLLIGVAFAVSRFVLPQIFKAVARLPELVLVGALAWCFLVAGLAGWLGLSAEMGALVAGVAISTFPYTLDVAAKVTGLRDFFVTLFFVGLGMTVPAPSVYFLLMGTVLALFVIASRLITVFPLLYRGGYGHRVSLTPAINLSQISEFSLVIIAIGSNVNYRHISADTRGIVAYAFVMLAVMSTYAVARSDELVRWCSPLLTKFGWLDLYKDKGDTASTHRKPKIFLLGFFWTASSLLEELRRDSPGLLRDLAVVDFNPHVNEELRRRGINIIYGDITQRDTLVHSGVAEAEILICTIPNSLLKGSTNVRLLRQLREINPTAQIIMHADVFAEAQELYQAGASFVSLPRITEAAELREVILAARNKILDQKRFASDTKLDGRREVIP